MTYKSFDEAVKVRKQAELDHGYHRNHGKTSAARAATDLAIGKAPSKTDEKLN